MPFEVGWGAALPLALIFCLAQWQLGPPRGIVAGVLLVISLVLHECGHVFAARLLQVETKAMGLCCMGGFTRRERATRPSRAPTCW